MPYKKLKSRDANVEDAATELTVLTEIRDLMSQGASVGAGGKHGQTAPISHENE